MAATPPARGTFKESFAKIAAMAPPRSRPESSISSVETTDQSSTTSTSVSSYPSRGRTMEKTRAIGAKSAPDDEHRASEDVAVEAAAALTIRDGANYEPAVTAGESEPGNDIRARGTYEAGALAPRAAASEISTKPSSLDGKSNMSASSALDEKDSLRPDDSASTRAAAEDEDNFAALQPSGPCSHSGSETGAGAAYRAQFHELSEQTGESQRPEVPDAAFIPPDPDGVGRAGSEGNNSHMPPLADSAAANGTNVPFGFSLEPDEKLVEALENPKDRLFVLRLEQDLIEFVKDSKEPFLELPPCNSFCRLLIHKLADYYFLTHFVDPAINSVRVFRTPFCRLPPPLTIISNPPTSGHTPPPVMPTVRIMRREASDKQGPKHPPDNRSIFDSSEPSQAASVADEMESETNKSSAESSAKEKGSLTREEREAKYREARERIFKDFEETEVDERTGTADASKQASRSSSRTGKNRIPGRKHRTNNDDGFEARSQFAAYFPPPQSAMHVPQGVPLYHTYAVHGAGGNAHALGGNPTRDYQAHHIGLVPNHAGMYAEPMVDSMGRPFSSPSSTRVGPSGQSGASSPTYPLGDYGFSPFQAPVSGHFLPQYRPTAYLHGQVTGPHWYQHPPLQNSYQADMASAAAAHQGNNNYPHMNPHMLDYQGPLQSAPSIANPSYQFGRLPSQIKAQPGFRVNYQHPLPGSFSRHAFNPQTLPFVPHGPHTAAMNRSPIPPPSSHSGIAPAQYPPSSSGNVQVTHDMGAMQAPANFPNAVMMLNVSSSPSSSQSSGAKYSPAPAGQGHNAAFTGHHHASRSDRHGPRNEQPKWEHSSGGLPPKPVVSSSMMHSPKARHGPAERRHAAYNNDAPPAIVNGSRIPVTSSPMPVSSAANA